MKKDLTIDYAFMATVEKCMRHEQKNLPDYMISGSRGDFPALARFTFSILRRRH